MFINKHLKTNKQIIMKQEFRKRHDYEERDLR